MIIIIYFILGVICFIVFSLIISYLLSCKPYQGPVTSNFNGQRFINPSSRHAKGLKGVLEYGTKRQPDKWPAKIKKNAFTFKNIDLTDEKTIRYTFVNHSTFLIQFKGYNILTDPVWSKRCSPFQFMGPARQRPPGIDFKDLPKIDLVLLSHNHYDHMDKNSLIRLRKEHNPQFIVPLGVGSKMKQWNCNQVKEMDWWQTVQLGEFQLSSTPANHFSSRGTFDRDKTLWCGYLLKTKGTCIYFAGDTGYSDVFKEIGDFAQQIDLAFLPIGAYLPEWFMSPIHVSPSQAVQIHLDINSKKSVAMHFGTFKLADDNPIRAKKELRASLVANNLTEDNFQIPNEGESYMLEELAKA